MRRSRAFWRTRPEEKAFGSAEEEEEVVESAAERESGRLVCRRCDSEMRRRSSRSWARREGASSGSEVDGFEEEGCVGVVFEEEEED